MYIFDTNSLSTILKYYYVDRFPTFWEKFHVEIDNKSIISVRETKRELEDRFAATAIKLLTDHNEDFFEMPSVEELEFITTIYSVPHFQQNIERKKLLRGGYLADPFLIAKAHAAHGTVVSEEELKPHAAKVPNICEHFHIECIKLEEFLTRENWSF